MPLNKETKPKLTLFVYNLKINQYTKLQLNILIFTLVRYLNKTKIKYDRLLAGKG